MKSVPSSAKIIAVVGSKTLDETLYDNSIAHESDFVNTSIYKFNLNFKNGGSKLPPYDE